MFNPEIKFLEFQSNKLTENKVKVSFLIHCLPYAIRNILARDFFIILKCFIKTNINILFNLHQIYIKIIIGPLI